MLCPPFFRPDFFLLHRLLEVWSAFNIQQCLVCVWSAGTLNWYISKTKYFYLNILGRFVFQQSALLTRKWRVFFSILMSLRNLFFIFLIRSWASSMAVVLCQIPFFMFGTGPLYLFLSFTIYIIFQMISFSPFVFFFVIVVVVIGVVEYFRCWKQCSSLFYFKVMWIVKECR